MQYYFENKIFLKNANFKSAVDQPTEYEFSGSDHLIYFKQADYDKFNEIKANLKIENKNQTVATVGKKYQIKTDLIP